MTDPWVPHLFRQLPAIAATLRVAMATPGDATAPGPELRRTVPPPSRALVDDYLRFVGGDPKAWRGRLPPHLFPHWGWPLLAEAMRGLPFDLKKVVNAGCSWTVGGPLPDDAPIELVARLESIDRGERRALVTLRLESGPQEARVTVLLPASEGPPGEKKPKPVVPAGARAIGERRLPKGAGLDFALLTGDFNPIHWVGPYARMAGFGGPILHGFASAAMAAEAIVAGRFAGDIDRLASFEARFTAPIRLPATVRFFVGDGGAVFVGTEPGGPAFLTGVASHA